MKYEDNKESKGCSYRQGEDCPFSQNEKSPIWCQFCSKSNEKELSGITKIFRDLVNYYESAEKTNLEFYKAKRRLKTQIKEELRKETENILIKQ